MTPAEPPPRRCRDWVRWSGPRLSTATNTTLTTLPLRATHVWLVAIQAGTEDFLHQHLPADNTFAIVSHRGTLDPCAFWQSFGNSRESFYEMTGTTLDEHYRRYDLVIHLESAGVRVPEAYVRYPHAHRPEDVGQAARLDHLLDIICSASSSAATPST